MVRAGKVFIGALVGLLLLCAGATALGDLLIGFADAPVGRFVETTAGRQQVLDVGPDFTSAADAPTIVLLHGATANLEDMRLALADRLRAGYRVIAVDRPGNGWSERTNGEADANPHRQAAVLHEILHKSGIVNPILLAHSWAGAVALAYALDYPNELRGLVLLAPVAYRWSSELSQNAELAATPWLGTLFAHTLAVPIAWLALDTTIRLAFAPEQPPSGYIENASILLALRPSAITANVEDLAQMDSFPTPQAAPYGKIRLPTVIVVGAADRLVPPHDQADVLARQMPLAKLVTLPGVGHMAHYAAPERIISEIDALAEATRPDAGQND